MIVAVLGADTARAARDRFEEFEEVVILDPSPAALEELLVELNDPRLDYLLGELPVLPLPDASVDLVLGAEAGDAEVARVRRSGAK